MHVFTSTYNVPTVNVAVLPRQTAAAAATDGGRGGAGGTKKKLQDATQDELMSLVRHHSSRLKIVEEEYGKLKQKVCTVALEFGKI